MMQNMIVNVIILSGGFNLLKQFFLIMAMYLTYKKLLSYLKARCVLFKGTIGMKKNTLVW